MPFGALRLDQKKWDWIFSPGPKKCVHLRRESVEGGKDEESRQDCGAAGGWLRWQQVNSNKFFRDLILGTKSPPPLIQVRRKLSLEAY